MQTVLHIGREAVTTQKEVWYTLKIGGKGCSAQQRSGYPWVVTSLLVLKGPEAFKPVLSQRPNFIFSLHNFIFSLPLVQNF